MGKGKGKGKQKGRIRGKGRKGLSGVYILIYFSPKDAKNEVCKRKKARGRGNSMSIHPEFFKNETIPRQFFANLEGTLSIMRHVKIQNFRLIALIAYDLWDFIFS